MFSQIPEVERCGLLFHRGKVYYKSFGLAIKVRKKGAQGGHLYAYGLLAMLDSPGEYYINATAQELWLIPPTHDDSGVSGTYSISRLASVVVAEGATEYLKTSVIASVPSASMG